MVCVLSVCVSVLKVKYMQKKKKLPLLLKEKLDNFGGFGLFLHIVDNFFTHPDVFSYIWGGL